ncbi:MAG: glycoside hydrolase family 43 protein [Bacteroidota bacterium]
MLLNIRLFFLSQFAFVVTLTYGQPTQSKPAIPSLTHTGEIWKDTDGNIIQAHGAGVLYHQGVYYLFGEIKKGKTWLVPNQSWECYRVQAGGVSCYSSKDLVNWKNEGIALAPNPTDATHDLHLSKVIERPKVVYNRQTRQFVMWMHVDSETYGYSQAGVAVSDQPAGPYRYLGSVRPNGQMARDMTLFKDSDEKAYLIFASESNATMHICQLSADYLSPTSTYKRILIGQHREAPAMFKHQGRYYLITSGCTGWAPNPAAYAMASQPLGEWKTYGNPCIGPDADSTFHAQSTFVLPLKGKPNEYLFMADRWNKLDLEDSRYVWLPLHMVNQQPQIRCPEN